MLAFKKIANYISISRIIMSIVLFFIESFSISFYIIYVYCGMSDMLDGYIARKSKTESELGSKLDSMADLIFIIVAMIKILPIIYLTKGRVIWLVLIAFIKVFNVIYGYIYYKKSITTYYCK